MAWMVQQQSVMFLTAVRSVAWVRVKVWQKSRDTGRARFIFNSARVAEICTHDARTFLDEPSSGSSTAPESLSPLLLLGCCVG